MTTPAVTDSASAAEELQTPQSMDEAVETGFLPDDPHYRLTGEFKPEKTDASAADQTEKKDDKTSQSENDDASAASADTAAASAAATSQEKKGKTAASSESRWAKLSRENREMREENARLKALAEGKSSTEEKSRETAQGSQPATEAKANAKPKIDDVDPKTGQPKFKTYGEYEDAKDEWLRKEAIREFQESSAKTAQERERQAAQEAIGKSLAQKFEPVRAKYADFDQVALNPDLLIPMGSVVDGFLQDSTHAGEVAYYLGQHPELLEGFYGNFDKATGKFVNLTTPQQQFRKLMEIEGQFSSSASTNRSRPSQTPPAKPITQAPRPPHQVDGKGTVAKDTVEQAVEDQDQETYMREANARELARRKRT